jgi:phosphoribosylformylglycinamidine cyclo-ligase
LRPGDVMLAAASSGIHANGLSLARKLASEQPGGYATPVPGDARGRGLGEVLLDPSPLYGPLLEALQRDGVDVHYAVHVTGHGWRKLMRAPVELSYRVDSLPEVPPVLRYLQSLAHMDDETAYGTFNMGIGYVFFVPSAHVERARAAAVSCGNALQTIGVVENGPRQVVIAPLGVRFAGASLAIR